MGSILDWSGLKQVLIDLFTPSDPSGFADQYLQGTANGFETPARSDSTVQDVLIFNDLIFDIAVFILGVFLIFLVTKLMFTGGGHSTVLKSGLRAILGIGLLAYNVELVFAFFEFTDGFVSALSWARVHYDSQTATDTFGDAIGVTAVPVTPITTGFFGAHMLGYLLTWVAVAIIALSLFLRDIILLGVIAFAPLMVVLWMFGPMVGVGRVGAGVAARVGLSRTMGGTGSMIADHIGSDSSDSAVTSSATRSTSDRDAATFGRGSARDDYHDAFYARDPGRIKESWDDTEPTIENDPYFDTTKHAPDVNPVKQANEPNVTEADDHEREDLLFAENQNLTDPDWTKLTVDKRKALAWSEIYAQDQGSETESAGIDGDPMETL